MNLKRIASLLMSIALLTAVSFTVSAEEDEDYCYDDSAFTVMTPEEVSARMLELGIGMDKMSVYSTGNLDDTTISVSCDYVNKRIEVYFKTSGTIVANEIGVKNLKFYRKDSGGDTVLKTDAKLYTGFQQSYSGGYYYNQPDSGKQYYADGTNYGIFTTTERAVHNSSYVLTY